MDKRDCIYLIGVFCGKDGGMCGEKPGTGLDACETAFGEEEEDEQDD